MGILLGLSIVGNIAMAAVFYAIWKDCESQIEAGKQWGEAMENEALIWQKKAQAKQAKIVKPATKKK